MSTYVLHLLSCAILKGNVLGKGPRNSFLKCFTALVSGHSARAFRTGDEEMHSESRVGAALPCEVVLLVPKLIVKSFTSAGNVSELLL